MKIIVCSAAALDDVIAEHQPSHVVTLLSDELMIERASAVAPEHHLRLSMNDVESPGDGMVLPARAHIERLIRFVDHWDQSQPMIIHCWAGISRSTAAAFTALCHLNPQIAEDDIARQMRAKSAMASPNRLIVAHADEHLTRAGRMISAVDEIGRGEPGWENQPFSLPIVLNGEG